MPLAQASAGRADRVPRMDQRQSPPTLTIRRASWRQAGEGRGARGLVDTPPDDSPLANKRRICYARWSAMAVQTCSVTFTDPRGVRHTVDVLAESLFEAAALGVAALKKDGWTDPVGPATTLQVEVRSPAIKHVVSVLQVERWLHGATTSPNERV